MMIGLVTGEEKCGCYVPTLRMLCTEEEEKAMVRSAPDGSDNKTLNETNRFSVEAVGDLPPYFLKILCARSIWYIPSHAFFCK